MNEPNKVTHYDEDIDIACPICGLNSWKLFKWGLSKGELYFRVACANGCYVDNCNNVNKGETVYSVIKTAFELIEADRK